MNTKLGVLIILILFLVGTGYLSYSNTFQQVPFFNSSKTPVNEIKSPKNNLTGLLLNTTKPLFQNISSSSNNTTTTKKSPTKTTSNSLTESSHPTSKQSYPQLIIPKLGIQCDIRSDTVNAYDAVYHYPNSVKPGQNGECGILGHRTTYSSPFQYLRILKPGDLVIITDTATNHKFTYKVISNGKDIRWDYKINPLKFQQSGDPRLLIVTCYPPGQKAAAWITHCNLISSTSLN